MDSQSSALTIRLWMGTAVLENRRMSRAYLEIPPGISLSRRACLVGDCGMFWLGTTGLENIDGWTGECLGWKGTDRKMGMSLGRDSWPGVRMLWGNLENVPEADPRTSQG